MNEFMSERAIALPSIFMRSTALILLVAFCGTALFGFTILYIFKPAPTQAFGFGGVITAILLMAYHTARDFLKAMAEAFVLRFISTMLLQLLRRLETLHVVKNIMYYADALQFNQYIGNKLNKIVDKPADPTQVKDTEADTNIANIIGVFSVLPIGSQIMSDQQLKTMATGGQLTPQQESTIVKGALAMLTTQGGCRGVNRTAIQNVSKYIAAKNAGVTARSIDPGSPNFYEQMTRLADPFSSPAYVELGLEDTAQQVEAEADAAANQELLSAGQKTGKSLDGNTIQAGQANIEERVAAALNGLVGTNVQSGKLGFASKIGSTLADFVTQAILRNDIRVTAEKGTCGTGLPIPSTPAPPWPPLPGGGTFNITMTVNGSLSTAIRAGETATLSWNVVEPVGPLTIYNLPLECSPPPLSGSCQVSPTADTTYVLAVDGVSYAEATITVISGFVESASISASPQLLPPGGTTVVSRNVVGSGIRATLNGSAVGLSGSQSFLLTTSGRTFTLDIFNSQTGEVLDTQSVSVNIQF